MTVWWAKPVLEIVNRATAGGLFKKSLDFSATADFQLMESLKVCDWWSETS